MINCVIIDDEKPARDALELMLIRYFPERVKVVAKAESLKEGVFAIYKHSPDLVFLDIEMPEEKGFEIFTYFQQVTFSVIFTTAYKEYAIKAIKLAALDYILKPVGLEDLKEAIALYDKRQLSGIPVESIEKRGYIICDDTEFSISHKDLNGIIDYDLLGGGNHFGGNYVTLSKLIGKRLNLQ